MALQMLYTRVIVPVLEERTRLAMLITTINTMMRHDRDVLYWGCF